MIPSPNSFFNIFGHDLPWYGVLFAIGLGVGGFASSFRSKRRGIERFDSICCAVYTGIGGLAGAKLFAWMTSFDVIIVLFQRLDPLTAIQGIMQGGFVFYGGLIGGFIGLILYCKEFKLPTIDFLDVFAVSVPLGHVFGRIGCFMSGCCYGMPHDGFLSVIYLEGITADINAVGVPRLAVQLIEAFSLLVLYIILETCFYKTKRKGLCTCLYIIGYSAIRFILEYFRGDPARGFLLGMTTSQLISVLLVATMVVVLLYNWFKKKYENGRQGFTDSVMSTVIGGLGFIFSLLLVISTSSLSYGKFGANVVYVVGVASLLSITINKAIKNFKACYKLKKANEQCDKNTFIFSSCGLAISAVGLILTIVSIVLIIVGVATIGPITI